MTRTDRNVSIIAIGILLVSLFTASLLAGLCFRIGRMDAIIRQGECQRDTLVSDMSAWIAWKEYVWRTRTGYVPERVKRKVDSVYRIKEEQ